MWIYMCVCICSLKGVSGASLKCKSERGSRILPLCVAIRRIIIIPTKSQPLLSSQIVVSLYFLPNAASADLTTGVMIGTRQARIAGHARCLFQLEGQCWKVLDVLNFILIVSNSAKWLIDWGWLLELGSYLNMFPNVYKIRKVTGNMILIRFRQMGSFYFALCMLWIIQTVGLFRYVWDCFLSFLCFPGNLHDIADTFSILLMCNLP